MIISHPGSLFSYITLRWILERGVQEGPIIRHYTVTRENTFRMTIPTTPLSFEAGLEEVAALVFTRRGVFVEVGPELRWAQTSIFGIRLSANDRARISFLLYPLLVGNWSLRPFWRKRRVIFNIILFGLVEMGYGAFKLRRYIVKISLSLVMWYWMNSCYLIDIFSVEVRYVIYPRRGFTFWESFEKFAKNLYRE